MFKTIGGAIMGKTGRAAVLDRHEGTFTVREAEVPQPKTGEVLVKQEMCGVCGTDVHLYNGHMKAKFPLVMGHEPVGLIDELGSKVTSDYTGRPVAEGDRIYIVPGIRCGSCYFCQVLKEPSLCLNATGYGFNPMPDDPPHFQGGYADYIYLNHPWTIFFKMNASPERSVFLEPFTIGLNQADKIRLHAGDTVVIQGAGAIGISALVASKLAGAHKAIVIGAPKSRLELAREFGADVTINIEEIKDSEERIRLVQEETMGGYGADAVFECTGVAHAVPEGLDMVRRGGWYVVAGHFTDVGDVPLNPYKHFNHKEVKLVGVWTSEVVHFLRGRDIVESGDYHFEKLVSHKLPLSRVKDAMDTIGKSYRLDGKEVRKVVIASGE
jgi:L-iditol 2-dehydrogenase